MVGGAAGSAKGWCVQSETGWPVWYAPLVHLFRTSCAPLVHLFRTFSLCTSLVPLSQLLVLFFTRVYRMDGLQLVGLRVQRRR